MEIISRKDAKALGLKRYYMGKACKYGHVAYRLVSNKVCSECNNKKQRTKEQFAEYYRRVTRQNPHYRAQKSALADRRHPEKQKEYYLKNRERILKSYQENKDEKKKNMKKYYIKNREKRLIYAKEYRKNSKLAKQDNQPT